MTLYLWLICAHFIGDFALQQEWVALNKGKEWYIMLAHCVIWAACIMLVLEHYEKATLLRWNFLWMGHFLCDTWKCRATKEFPTWHFYTDQAFHVLFQLTVVSI